MSAVANALSGSPDDIQSILAQLNQLLTPTEKLPGTQSPANLLLAMPQQLAPTNGAPAANSVQSLRLPSMGVGQGAPAAPSSSSTGGILQSLANPNSPITKAISSYLHPNTISNADAANWASGAPTDSAVSQALGGTGNVTNDGTAAAVQASNDAALASNAANATSDLGTAASLYGQAADAGIGSVVAPELASESAAIQASNDAALNAVDGGAAGAGAGTSGGLGVGSALGALGAGYSLYNTAANWQSGNTGSDAMNGGETGATIGAEVGGPYGAVIGGVLGAAAGALSSAFGGGEKDPETTNWNSVIQQAQGNPSVISGLTPSEAYQSLAGIMDAKNNTPGHSTALEQHFGRMGEGSLMDQMASQVNSAISANPQLKNDSPSQMYSSVVEPWLKQEGAYVPSNAIVSSNGSQAGSSVDSLLTNLLGDWMGGSINTNSQLGVSGQTIGGLANYLGLTPEEIAAMQGPKATPMQQSVLGQIKGLA